MKDCEPLRRKKLDWSRYSGLTVYDMSKNFDEFFDSKDIASAVRFYKYYKDNPNRLFSNEPADIIDDFRKWAQERYPNMRTDDFNPMKAMRKYAHDIYNDWLFDYCFLDIIE